MAPKAKVIVSLCLNVVLGFVYFGWAKPTVTASAPSESLGSAGEIKHEGAKVPAETNSLATAVPSPKFPRKGFKWALIEAADYQQYVANLRAVGCPEETIRDIILADLDAMYEPQLNQLRGINRIAPREPYWRVPRPVARPPLDEDEPRIKELKAERAGLLKVLLGVNESVLRTAYDWHDDGLQSRYSFLTADQRNRLKDVERRFVRLPDDQGPENGMMMDLGKGLNEVALQKMREEMAKFLTPKEIHEYELRTSAASAAIRLGLRGVTLSEAEFRALYDVIVPLSQELKGTGNANGRVDAETAQLKEHAKLQFTEILGPERFKELERSKDPGYEGLVSAAPYLGYSADAAAKVMDIRADAAKAVEVVRTDLQLTEVARAQALQEIRQKTELAVTALVGRNGLDYYLRREGKWIRDIAPHISTARKP